MELLLLERVELARTKKRLAEAEEFLAEERLKVHRLERELEKARASAQGPAQTSVAAQTQPPATAELLSPQLNGSQAPSCMQLQNRAGPDNGNIGVVAGPSGSGLHALPGQLEPLPKRQRTCDTAAHASCQGNAAAGCNGSHTLCGGELASTAAHGPCQPPAAQTPNAAGAGPAAGEGAAAGPFFLQAAPPLGDPACVGQLLPQHAGAGIGVGQQAVQTAALGLPALDEAPPASPQGHASPPPDPAPPQQQPGPPLSSPVGGCTVSPVGAVAPAVAPPPRPAHLLALQAWLNQQHEAASAGGASAGGPAVAAGGGGQPPLPLLDLGGATLRDDPQHPLPQGLLRLPPGTRLANGKLEGCCVLVEGPGAEVVLEGLEVTGDPGQLPGADFGRPASSYLDLAVVAVSGPGSGALLTACRVTAGPQSGAGTDCVLVQKGARAELRGCTLSGAKCAGLFVEDNGSTARAEDSTAVQNGHAGFVAAEGGSLKAERCTADQDGEPTTGHAGTELGSFGFVAKRGGQLEACGGCVALAIGATGFAACGAGSNLTAHAGCTAVGNGYCGFLASQGGCLDAGAGCTANANGRIGFLAIKGGAIVTGADCSAADNGATGFLASGHRSHMVVGAGCRAESNSEVGFYANALGCLTALRGCVSRRNGRGFMAEGGGSRLRIAESCRAEANTDCGFLALLHGLLQAGPGCVAAGNQAEGFATVGGAMTLGQGCSSEGNGSDGFAASRKGGPGFRKGGSLVAPDGGCVAEGNVGDGFCCEDARSTMSLGPGTKAVGNGGSGFLAKGGGEVRICSGAETRRNGGWGLHVSGSGSKLMVVLGGGEADNEKGPACEGVRIVASADDLRGAC